jgi:hypothetical protein
LLDDQTDIHRGSPWINHHRLSSAIFQDKA